jgi:hypothetical protein
MKVALGQPILNKREIERRKKEEYCGNCRVSSHLNRDGSGVQSMSNFASFSQEFAV